MIKLTVVMCFRKLSFGKTISSITDEEAVLLRFVDVDDNISLLTGATLHYFVKCRLKEKGFQQDPDVIVGRIKPVTFAPE